MATNATTADSSFSLIEKGRSTARHSAALLDAVDDWSLHALTSGVAKSLRQGRAGLLMAIVSVVANARITNR
jgi:hypothetical protein